MLTTCRLQTNDAALLAEASLPGSARVGSVADLRSLHDQEATKMISRRYGTIP